MSSESAQSAISLYVKGFPPVYGPDDLKVFFTKHVNDRVFKITMPKESYAFVEFYTKEDSDCAIRKLNNFYSGCSRYTVKYSDRALKAQRAATQISKQEPIRRIALQPAASASLKRAEPETYDTAARQTAPKRLRVIDLIDNDRKHQLQTRLDQSSPVAHSERERGRSLTRDPTTSRSTSSCSTSSQDSRSSSRSSSRSDSSSYLSAASEVSSRREISLSPTPEIDLSYCVPALED